MIPPEYDRLIDQVVQTLNNMTTAQMSHRLAPFVTKDVSFCDPRLSAQGPDGLAEAYRSLFDGADSMLMRVTDRAWGLDGHTVYLRWDRLLRFPGGATCAYTGISEMMVSISGQIATITDHWDPTDHVLPRPGGLLGRLLKR